MVSPGERRRRKAKRERDQAAYEAVMAPLRAAGACCGSCQHRGKYPMTDDPICELDSDFEGYCKVKLDHLCPQYAARV